MVYCNKVKWRLFMKTIGLIGGMSWKSSLEYYRLINEHVSEKLGGVNSSKSLMYSFNFDDINNLMLENDWRSLQNEMVFQAEKMKEAGADFIVICTNTMHKTAPAIEINTGLKVLHIADVTGSEIKKQGLNKVALLGTKFVMEGNFYKDYLLDNYGIETIVPKKESRDEIHNIIFNELVRGVITKKSKLRFMSIIEALAIFGAQGVILGCTEIPMIINENDVSIQVFNTTELHAKAAAEYSLKK